MATLGTKITYLRLIVKGGYCMFSLQREIMLQFPFTACCKVAESYDAMFVYALLSL